MKEYHKINTLYKRDEVTKKIIPGEFSMPEFEYLYSNRWLCTEKLDGTNIRIIWDGIQVRFGGKTDTSQIPMQLLAVLQDLFPDDKMRKAFGPEETEGLKPGHEVCLYGEGIGFNIQSKVGKLYIPDSHTFVLFDVKIGDWWLEWKNVVDVAQKLNIKHVPVVGEAALDAMISKVRSGFPSLFNSNAPAEGIVARPLVDLFNRKGERIVVKLKTKDFESREARP